MPRARRRARGTPSPPLAPSDSAPGWTPGLARCGAGPRRLCVARWPRAPLPPSAGGGGRRASTQNASDARRRIAPDGRFPCSESASRRLFLAASGLAAVGGLAVLNVRPRRHAPCLPRRSVCAKTGLALFHPLPSIPPSAFCTSHTRRLPAARRNSQSQNGFVSELRRALRKRKAEELAAANGSAVVSAALVHAYDLHQRTATSRFIAQTATRTARVSGLFPSSNPRKPCCVCLPRFGRLWRIPSEPWTAFDKDRPRIGRLLE